MIAVRAADPIANPFPTAAVVFPTLSSSSVMSRTSEGKSLMTAKPPALSAIGPYASTESCTPRVTSIPTAEVATPYNPAKL